MPQQQIIAWGVYSSSEGAQDPLLVAWCDVGDFTDWTASATNQAGSFRIPTGSKVVGGIAMQNQVLLITDVDAWAMSYSGYPYVYNFNRIGQGCGLVGPQAVAVLNNVAVWMTQRGFFMYNGGTVTPVPCTVWDTVFSNTGIQTATANLQINNNVIALTSAVPAIYGGEPVVGAGIPNNTFVQSISGSNITLTNNCTATINGVTVSFGSPSIDLTFADAVIAGADSSFNEIFFFYPTIGSGGQVTNYVKLNLVDQVWDCGTLQRSAWIDQSVLGEPIGADYNGLLQQHETSDDFDGVALDSYAETGFFEITEGMDYFYLDRILPDFILNPTGQVQVTIKVVNYPNDTPMVYGPYPVTQTTQYLVIRSRGRLMSMRVENVAPNTFYRYGETLALISSAGSR
jgi:hypothetical protein